MTKLFHIFEVVDIHFSHVTIFHHLLDKHIGELYFFNMAHNHRNKEIHSLHIAYIWIRYSQHPQNCPENLY